MPSPSDLDAAIRAQFDQFLGTISSLVRRSALESVRSALEVGPAPAARRGPGRKPRAQAARRSRPTAKVKARRSRVGRPPLPIDEKIAQALVAYIRTHPGERLEQIGRALKRPTAPLKRPASRLLSTGVLRTEGRKRGTRYFATGRGGGQAKPARAQRRPKRRGRKAGRRKSA